MRFGSTACGRSLVRAIVVLLSATLLLAVPIQGFNATSDPAAVNALPRFALVIGNGRYNQVPLKNAPNDAKAIAEQLQRMGFDVTLKLDASRSEMIETIRAFGAKLTKQKGIGLFYFAGHGAQLAWRNYLIPVDAAIKEVAQVDAQAVDLDRVLEGITRARNPLNLVILDACRDNPFGGDVVLQQKGLSQVDAPVGTLLAYATAPGNTAADGSGANGLYTEHMLKEMQTPGAKIEDIFKRVRLNVRMQSRGQQVPWESTSLEDDFYFLPPKQVRKLAPDEVERLFDEELALWEKIKTSTELAPLENYLRRFPSGKFSELAQFRLDRILEKQGEKLVQSVNSPENPFSRGTGKVNTDFAIGDRYAYRRVDTLTKAETSFTLTVTDITDEVVVYNKGTQVRDLLGNVYKSDWGDFASADGSAAQLYAAEYRVGKKWSARHKRKTPDGRTSSQEYDFKVVTKEKIQLPAGEFEAFKVEGKGFTSTGASLQFNYWVAPDKVRRVIAYDELYRGRDHRITTSQRTELASFRQLRQP